MAAMIKISPSGKTVWEEISQLIGMVCFIIHFYEYFWGEMLSIWCWLEVHTFQFYFDSISLKFVSICGNSLFFDPFQNKIYDYADGMADLKSLKVVLHLSLKLLAHYKFSFKLFY